MLSKLWLFGEESYALHEEDRIRDVTIGDSEVSQTLSSK